MTMADVAHGPDWPIWVIIVILAIISLVLLSGHGGGLIAGYNTASKEQKEKYDVKKLCRTIGGGIAVIAILLLVVALFQKVLPVSFAYILAGSILADIVGMLILANTVCKKK